MTPFPQLIADRLTTALETLDLDLDGFTPGVSQATDPRFGHYQSNAAMVLAKRNKENPRLLAERVVDVLKISDLCDKPEIAGPGFLNFRIETEGFQDLKTRFYLFNRIRR